MLMLRRWKSRLDAFEPSCMSVVSEAIQSELRPILRPARESQALLLGLVSSLETTEHAHKISSTILSSGTNVLQSEIFTDGAKIYIVTIEEKRAPTRMGMLAYHSISTAPDPMPQTEIELTYIGPSLDAPMSQKVRDAVNQSFSVDLKETFFVSSKFKQLQEEGKSPSAEPSQDEKAASRILADRYTRTLAIAVKSSGGLLVTDLPRQLPPEGRDRTQEIRSSLSSHGLIESETVIVCTKTQSQVARLGSSEALKALTDAGVKCACGRPIGEEKQEEAISITELGRNLLDKSRWLTIILIDELLRLGVPIKYILVEQSVGGDEVDCLADISGELVFFELKDKEFNLGNAYSFGSKVGIIRPNHSVIVSTQHVGGDARDHFQRAKQAGRRLWETRDEPSLEIRYVEGIENMRSKLEELVGEIYRSDSEKILSKVLPTASLNSDSVLNALQSRWSAQGEPEAVQEHEACEELELD